MITDLLLCTSCARHVKRGTETCPFCGATAAPREHTAHNTSARIALVVVATASVLGVAACSSSEAIYGAPCVVDGVSRCGYTVDAGDAGDGSDDANDGGPDGSHD